MDYSQQIFCFTFLIACAIVCHADDVQLETTSNQVEEHDQVTLTCRASAATEFTWNHNGKSVATDDDKFKYVFGTVAGKSEGKLTILEMEHENEGSYVCKANGHTSNTVNITAVHHIYHVSTSRSTVFLTAGSPLTLTCQADIHTELVWFRGSSTSLRHGDDDVTITVSKDESKHLLTSTLKIDSANDHTGTYSCQSAHMHDHDNEDKAVITVKLGEPADTSSAVTYALKPSLSTSFKTLLYSALFTSLLLLF